MRDEYRAEPYAPEHRSAVVALMAQLLPGRTPDQLHAYLHWKYEENPYLSPPLIALVFGDRRLVAMRGATGSAWHSDGETELRLPCAGDLVIDQDHRQRGLFLLLDRALGREAAQRGFTSLVSLSASNDTTRGLQAATGWNAVHTIETRYRPASASSNGLRSVLVRGGRRLLDRVRPSSVLGGMFGSRRSHPSPITFSDQPDYASLVRWAGRSSELRQARTETFYRWRLANPDRRYHFVYWRDDSVRGFLCLALPRRRGRHVRIVESGAEHPDILRLMVSAVASAPDTALTVSAAALPRLVSQELAGLGFSMRPRPFVTFYAKSLSAVPPAVPSSQRWHVDLLDTMLV